MAQAELTIAIVILLREDSLHQSYQRAHGMNKEGLMGVAGSADRGSSIKELEAVVIQLHDGDGDASHVH